jgi:hypothetical protein
MHKIHSSRIVTEYMPDLEVFNHISTEPYLLHKMTKLEGGNRHTPCAERCIVYSIEYSTSWG